MWSVRLCHPDPGPRPRAPFGSPLEKEGCRTGRAVGRSAGGYAGGVAWREEHGRGSILEVVNPDDDTSAAAVAAWIAALEQDGDWIDLPVTAAELVGEDRATRES